MTIAMKMQESFQAGLEQGIEQGIEQGSKDNALKNAAAFLKLNKLSVEEIAYGTGLEIEEIEALKKELEAESE